MRRFPLTDFSQGVIRLTRTPGLVGPASRNTITLPDLLETNHLRSAFAAPFFIEDDLFFSFFPRNLPLVVSRHFCLDGMAKSLLPSRYPPLSQPKDKLLHEDIMRAAKAVQKE
jgi:hypothetical protein